MIKIAFVGDPHLTEQTPRSRKDNFLDSLLVKIDDICENNDVICFLGDVFHKPGVSIYTVFMVMEVLRKHITQGKKIYSVVGNHDVYNMNTSEEKMKKVALQLLESSGCIELPDSINPSLSGEPALPG